MVEIILHEQAWVEDALKNMQLGKRPSETIGRIAKYYCAKGYKKADISRMIEEFMLKCDPAINIVRWQPIIDTIVRGSDKYPLIELDGVDIYEGEMEQIKQLNGRMAQKLMFTLLCLAKYANAVNAENNNWVNQDSRTIFSLANVAITTKRQALMINDLWQSGLIGYSRVVDNVNINVKTIANDGEVAIRVSDFRNIGNQYLMYAGENYCECQNCGLVVRKSSNAMKFCRDCAVDVNRQRTSEKYWDFSVA